MTRVLLLEPDRVAAKCIVDELTKRNMRVSVATTAGQAISIADKNDPDIVISEISLPGHSGTEFIYEFRTYNDWQEIPLLIYSSMKSRPQITNSKDWELLGISEYLYKPDCSLQTLGDSVEAYITT